MRWGACGSSALPPFGKKREKHTKKNQPTHDVSSSHPESFSLPFYHRLYCCPGQSLKLWIFLVVFSKEQCSQMAGRGARFSPQVRCSSDARACTQHPAGSLYLWVGMASPLFLLHPISHVLWLGSTIPGVLQVHLSESSCEDLPLPPALPQKHRNNQKRETSSHNMSELFSSFA